MKHSNGMEVAARLGVRFAQHGTRRRATRDHRSGSPEFGTSGPNGHVMVVVPGGEFVMGSPVTERGQSADETPHRVRIPRTFAIATTETTNQQFAGFLAAVPDYAMRWKAATAARFGDPPRFAQLFKEPPTVPRSLSVGTMPLVTAIG